MNRAQVAAWQAFFLQLEGSANTFYGFDPDAINPRGAGGGTPLVNGGSQTGSTLATDGWPNSTTVLCAGDYFSVNGELKMVTADATTNGSGQVTLNFKPALRSSPVDNSPLTITQASCLMVLMDDSQSMWQSGNRLGFYEGMSFSAYEVFS